jgi:hypothetical protein
MKTRSGRRVFPSVVRRVLREANFRPDPEPVFVKALKAGSESMRGALRGGAAY